MPWLLSLVRDAEAVREALRVMEELHVDGCDPELRVLCTCGLFDRQDAAGPVIDKFKNGDRG